MQIVMAHVKSCVSGPCDPEQSVQIRLIVNAQSACLMDDVHELADLFIVNPCILRICDHQRRRVFRHCGLQGFNFRNPVFIRIQCDHFIAKRVTPLRISG